MTGTYKNGSGRMLDWKDQQVFCGYCDGDHRMRDCKIWNAEKGVFGD